MASDGCIAGPVHRSGLNWNALLVAGFLTLSALDLLLTRQLLTTPGTCFYEANPVAARILRTAGWWGLGLFKLACAGTVVGVYVVLARRRPWLARAVLAGAVPVVCLVVGYSLFLAGGSDRRAIVEAHERQRELDHRKRDRLVYQGKLDQAAREVLARQQSLPEAARALLAYLPSLHYNPLYPLENYYPTLSNEGRLAVSVFREASYLLQNVPAERRHAALARLTTEFTATYACPVPRPNGPAYADAGTNAPAGFQAPLTSPVAGRARPYPHSRSRHQPGNDLPRNAGG
jgi:hypothetical protein